MESIKKVLITGSGKKFFAKSLKEDLHTQYGMISQAQLSHEDGSIVSSNTSKEFHMFSPSLIDLYRKIKRDAQIIPLKDIGLIITETGVNRNSRILDAGAGSGALACFLALIAKEVITYELRQDFYEVAKRNVEFLELKNVVIKNKNIYTDVEESDIDIATLDVPEPWNALDSVAKALKPGAFIVSYSPSVPQVADFVNALRKNANYIYLKTSELVEREWEVEERKVRPKSQGIGHSGFLTFARKVT